MIAGDLSFTTRFACYSALDPLPDSAIGLSFHLAVFHFGVVEDRQFRLWRPCCTQESELWANRVWQLGIQSR